MLTYKFIFEKLGFWTKLDSDFGCILTNEKFNFMLYHNQGSVNCFCLDYFQDMSVEDLVFLFNIDPVPVDDVKMEEYEFENTTTREHFLSFVFNLSKNKNESFYTNDLFNRVEEKNQALLLKSSNTFDKMHKSKVVNLIAFDKSTSKLQFNNSSCFFAGDSIDSRKQCYIFWNAEALIDYRKNLIGSDFSTFLFPPNADKRTLKIPFSVKFENYFLCFSSIDDQVEILRMIMEILTIETERLWSVVDNGNRLHIETQYFSRDEVLSWTQLIADIRKNIRDGCYMGEKRNFEFITDENLTIGEAKFYYISLVKASRLLYIFTEKLLKTNGLQDSVHVISFQN